MLVSTILSINPFRGFVDVNIAQAVHRDVDRYLNDIGINKLHEKVYSPLELDFLIIKESADIIRTQLFCLNNSFVHSVMCKKNQIVEL